MIYLIHGEELYFINKKIDEICLGFNEIISLDGESKDFDLNDLIYELSSVSLFEDRKVIKVKNLDFLNHKIDNEKITTLFSILNSYNRDDELIFYSDNQSVNGTLKTVKDLKKIAKEFKFEKVKNYDLPKYINHFVKEYHLNLAQKELDFLYKILPNDLKKIEQELFKLSLYPEMVTVEVISKLINLDIDDNIFSIIDCILKNNLNDSLVRLNELFTLNVYPLIIVSMIANQFRFLLKLLYLKNKNMSVEEIASFLKQNSYRILKSFEVLENYSFNKILFILKELALLEQGFKSDNTIDAQELFEIFIIRIMKKEIL